MSGKLVKITAAGLVLLGSVASALAGSVTQPGETVGIAAGTPLPPGFYLVDTTDWGCRNTKPEGTCVGVTIPVYAWSTPWTFLGARVQLLAATPAVDVGVNDTFYKAGWYNPLTSTQLAWDLGNGFGFSYLIGMYWDVNSPTAWSTNDLNQRFALSYTGYGWNLTANAIWGIDGNHVTTRPQLSPCPVSVQFPSNGCNPNFLNVDLTATKKFGKWEFGWVGYYSTDLNTPVPGYLKQKQFAMGGLVGYDLGPMIIQGYLTTDVYERNYGGNDVRGWVRVIFPLGDPFAAPAAPAPVVYRR